MIADGAASGAKQAVGKAAAELVQPGMLIGLGTGSTASCFIESLIERKRLTGLHFQAVATSEHSAEQAQRGGIPLCDINEITALDLTVDGADEIDPKKRMIKGAGGALLREKIVASMSKEMVVIVDVSKVVERLGGCPLPLEVLPFAHRATLNHIHELGYHAKIRARPEGSYFITDNGNFIVDVFFDGGCQDPERDENLFKEIPGVLETGFFFGLAGRVLIGYPDGTVIAR